MDRPFLPVRHLHNASLDELDRALMEKIAFFKPAQQAHFGYQNALVREADLFDRKVDCLHLPDAAVRSLGLAGSALTYSRTIDHPWDEPWLLTHTWCSENAPENVVRCVYLVEPASTRSHFGMRVTEFGVFERADAPFLAPLFTVDLSHRDPNNYAVGVFGNPASPPSIAMANSCIGPVMAALALRASSESGAFPQSAASPAGTTPGVVDRG